MTKLYNILIYTEQTEHIEGKSHGFQIAPTIGDDKVIRYGILQIIGKLLDIIYR